MIEKLKQEVGELQRLYSELQQQTSQLNTKRSSQNFTPASPFKSHTTPPPPPSKRPPRVQPQSSATSYSLRTPPTPPPSAWPSSSVPKYQGYKNDVVSSAKTSPQIRPPPTRPPQSELSPRNEERTTNDSPNREKRVEEIINSERDYVRDLNVIKNVRDFEQHHECFIRSQTHTHTNLH